MTHFLCVHVKKQQQSTDFQYDLRVSFDLQSTVILIIYLYIDFKQAGIQTCQLDQDKSAAIACFHPHPTLPQL